MIEQTFIPGIVEMHDDAGTPYLVDETLFDIIQNRRIWTDPVTKELMIDEVRHRQAQTVSQYKLADWWYRIMSLRDLPDTLNIGFLNDDNRDLRYKNLVRLAKGDTAPCLNNNTRLINP